MLHTQIDLPLTRFFNDSAKIFLNISRLEKFVKFRPGWFFDLLFNIEF